MRTKEQVEANKAAVQKQIDELYRTKIICGSQKDGLTIDEFSNRSMKLHRQWTEAESYYDAGEQVLVIHDSKFHRRGEILEVNHDNHPTHVWVHSKGLGSIIERDCVRLADDSHPNYMMTVKEWKEKHGHYKQKFYFAAFCALYLLLNLVMIGA